MEYIKELKAARSERFIKEYISIVAKRIDICALIPEFYDLQFDKLCSVIQKAYPINPVIGKYILQQANIKYGIKTIRLLEFMDMKELSLTELTDIVSSITSIPLLNKLNKKKKPSGIDWSIKSDSSSYDEDDFEPENYEKNIYKAAWKGDTESVMYTLKKHPKMLNAPNEGDELTITNISCISGHFNLFEKLLEKKPLLEIPDSKGRTPLINAAKNNNYKMVNTLIKKKVDINHKDNKGETALFHAAEKGDWNSCQYLLMCNADVDESNDKGETPLMVACKIGSDSIVKDLIEYDANPRAVSKDGRTVLDYARIPPILKIIKKALK